MARQLLRREARRRNRFAAEAQGVAILLQHAEAPDAQVEPTELPQHLLRPHAMDVGAVALAPRRAWALAAVEAAHRLAAHRRLAAGQAGALRVGVAARGVGRVATPVAVAQGLAGGLDGFKGHGVGCEFEEGVSRFRANRAVEQI
jgi:hypothetical protein